VSGRVVGEPRRLDAYTEASRQACRAVDATEYGRAIRAYRDASPNDLRPDVSLFARLFDAATPDLSNRIDATIGSLQDLADHAGAFAWALRQVDRRAIVPWEVPGMAGMGQASTTMPDHLQLLIDLRLRHPNASDDRIRDLAVDALVERDAAALRDLPDPWGQRRIGDLDAGYPDLAATMADIRRRAALIDGHAERLFVDELGAAGVDQVLARIEAYADAAGRGFLPFAPARLRGDLLVPFAAAFARAADHPELVAMTRDPSPAEAGRLALLLDASRQPTEFVVAAAGSLLLRDAMSFHLEHLAQEPGVQHWLFAGESFPGWATVAVRSLAADVEASHRFIERGDDAIEALLRSRASLPDQDVYYSQAGRVLENALHRWPARNPDATDQAIDTFFRVADLFGDGGVPDPMKRQFAAIVSQNFPLLAERLVFDDEHDGAYTPIIQDMFKEISHDDIAIATLQPGLAAFMEDNVRGSLQLAVDELDDTSSPGDISSYFGGTGQRLSRLLSAMGVGFAAGDASRAQRHELFIGGLRTVGTTSTRAGIAASPLSGGGSVAVGTGLGVLVDRGADLVAGWTAPDVRTAEDFLDQSLPAYGAAVERLLYDDPTIRAYILERAGAEDEGFEAFRRLEWTRNVVAPITDDPQNSQLAVLWSLYVDR